MNSESTLKLQEEHDAPNLRRYFNRRASMNNIFWIIGVVVVIGLIFGFIQLN